MKRLEANCINVIMKAEMYFKEVIFGPCLAILDYFLGIRKHKVVWAF